MMSIDDNRYTFTKNNHPKNGFTNIKNITRLCYLEVIIT